MDILLNNYRLGKNSTRNWTMRKPPNILAYIIGGFLLSFLPATVLVLILRNQGYYEFGSGSLHANPGLLINILLIVIISPLIETLVIMWLILIIEKLFKKNKLKIMSISVATIMAALHGLFHPIWGIVILWPMFVFTVTFVEWKEHHSAIVGYFASFTVHAAYNLGAIIVTLL